MRMRVIIVCLVLVIGWFSSLGIGVASAESSALKKLGRGVVNVLTSPLEIPKQARAYWIQGAYKTDHVIVWIVSGAVKGVVEDIKRFGSGAWDMVSFPIDCPTDYEPLLKPDYVFQDWPRDPDVFIFLKKDRTE